MMLKKRTIEAYFGQPKAKKQRDSSPQTSDQEAGALTSRPSTVADNQPTRHSTHDSYPFPIPHLPDALESEIMSVPARDARIIADQPNLDLLYFEPFIPRKTARQFFEFLRSELPFYRVEYDIARGGIKAHIRTPRWTTVFGLDDTAHFETDFTTSPGSSRALSSKGKVIDTRTGRSIPIGQSETQETTPQKRETGYKAVPRPIPHCLDLLRKSTEAATGCQFNFCLVNYYASGADSISFHSDDERFLGPLPAIASFSLGARRDFLMKQKPPKSGSGGDASSNSISKGSLKLPLESGDMVLMRGKTQANWLHSIPKRSGKNEWDGGRINITFRRALVRGGTENYYQYNVGNGPVYRWDAACQEMKPWVQASRP
ncbi:DNA repair family protein [Xylaria sp. FL0043]|nr:DNA repair family protein [Xylaria sp. FL0043]